MTIIGMMFCLEMNLNNVFGSDGKVMVWGKVNKELEKKNLRPTVKYEGGGVMVRGCMAASGVGELVFIDLIMD